MVDKTKANIIKMMVMCKISKAFNKYIINKKKTKKNINILHFTHFT